MDEINHSYEFKEYGINVLIYETYDEDNERALIIEIQDTSGLRRCKQFSHAFYKESK